MKGNEEIITDAPDRIMNIAIITPEQADLETNHDLLEFDSASRPQYSRSSAVFSFCE